jgi:hypothetical protein
MRLVPTIVSEIFSGSNPHRGGGIDVCSRLSFTINCAADGRPVMGQLRMAQ